MITRDIPPNFDRMFPEACVEIGCEPIDLLGVMFSESGCQSHAINDGPAGAPESKRYNAVGLIQFMPATLPNVGWHHGHQAFRHLDACGQLPYVIAYYNAWARTGAPWDSAGRLYQATFVPATMATQRDPADVLVQRGGRLGWCYSANAAFDADKNGAITIQELTDAIHRNARGPRWEELCTRLRLETHEDRGDRVETIRDVQEALTALGIDAGTVDGYDGPRTRAGVRAFQEAHELDVDGIAGPITRALLAELWS